MNAKFKRKILEALKADVRIWTRELNYNLPRGGGRVPLQTYGGSVEILKRIRAIHLIRGKIILGLELKTWDWRRILNAIRRMNEDSAWRLIPKKLPRDDVDYQAVNGQIRYSDSVIKQIEAKL